MRKSTGLALTRWLCFGADMKQFEVIEATFKPKRIDDLVEGSEAWIGRRTQWQAAWILEDGPYNGEWAMTPHGDDRFKAPFAWVPLSDLET
jgi:hypothetical protein